MSNRYDNSDYYNYNNQKYDLPKPVVAKDLTSSEAVLKAYQQGIRIFKNIHIEKGSFANKNLEGIHFENSRLYADFQNANLSYATFEKGQIRTSDFRNANLTNATFKQLAVDGTRFEGAKTTGFLFEENSAYGNNALQQTDFEKLFLTATPTAINTFKQEKIFMKVEFWVIGKTSFDYLDKGNEVYISRIKHYLPFQMITIPDIKNRKNLSEEEIKTREGEIILSKLNTSDLLILMDEKGKQRTSIQFSDYLQTLLQQSSKRAIFLIGGAYGFSKNVYERSNAKVSLSNMTFSHQMVRLIFLEQFYRALTIMNNEPYHHK